MYKLLVLFMKYCDFVLTLHADFHPTICTSFIILYPPIYTKCIPKVLFVYSPCYASYYDAGSSILPQQHN